MGRRAGVGEGISQTQQQQQQQQQTSQGVKNKTGAAQNIQKMCVECGASDRDKFSKKQWVGKAHSRRCLTCAALPAGSSASGDGESAQLLGATEGAGGGDSTSQPALQRPRVEQEREVVRGPIVPRAVLVAKVLDASAYAELPVYVEEECFVCMDAWDAPGLGASAVVLPCKHAICLACMADWISSSATKNCPTYRARVPPALAEVVLGRVVTRPLQMRSATC